MTTSAETATVTGSMGPRFAEILTPEALAFLAGLHRKFDARRKERDRVVARAQAVAAE